MKQRNKHIQCFFILFLFGIGVFFPLFVLWKIRALEAFHDLKRLYSHRQSNSEMKGDAHPSPIVESQQDSLEIYEEENSDLKERSFAYSPDKKKIAYYQNKFVHDIKEIGDPDYTSLIVEQNGKKEAIFQGNFHLSHFEWISNSEIKVYKGCGSSCLLSYVINIHSKKYKEGIEQVFHFE